MSVTYTLEDDLVWLHHDDDYTTDDVRRALVAALADASLPPDRRKFLMDVTQSRSLAERSVEEVKSMAAFFASHADTLNGRLAILATEGLYYGLMRIAAAYAECSNLTTKVFSDCDAALAWLHNEDDPFPGF